MTFLVGEKTRTLSVKQRSVMCSISRMKQSAEGRGRRAGILAEKLHLPMALIHKESFNEEHIISGNVQDKKVRVRASTY